MSKFNIAVLGPIPRDHITTHKGEVIEKYGGVNNPVIAISKLLEDQGTVYPVTHVRKSDHEPINEILKPYKNVNLDFIRSDADMGDIISLTFVDQNKRLEKQTGLMNPILPADVEGILHCDVFVCVPITDFEIPYETIRYIKENSKGVIIFDAHGPTNSLTIHGDRVIRFWADRDVWLPFIDVLKMNLEESNACWFKKEYTTEELENFDVDSQDHLEEFAKHVLDRGVKALIVTLDDRGCVVFTKADGKISHEFVRSVWVDNVVDTTGCGDSFAGGLGFGLLENSTDYIRAMQYANALGAQRTQGRTFDVFKSRKETDAIIATTYAENVDDK
ncbi:MAG: PfkB family carbohydrate kinase [Cyclobacteriaceae bacterium]